MKPCITCGVSKPVDEFYTHPRMVDGHLNKCKECVKAYQSERRIRGGAVESDARRERSDRRREWRIRYAAVEHRWTKAPKRAHKAVRKALAEGALVRPQACQECGAASYLEAAHHDYSKPLDVRWLCRPCHRRWDAHEPKTLVA